MAWRRPGYLRETLEAWSQVRGAVDVKTVAIALGEHPPTREHSLAVISLFEKSLGRPVEIWPDSPEALAAPAGHRAIGEAFQRAFSDPDIDFVAYSEEDLVPSADTLELLMWEEEQFRDDDRVLMVCAHNHAFHDWLALGIAEADADPSVVRLRPNFAGWGYGIWRERFQSVLEPVWDWNCSSGGPGDLFGQGPAGQDWNIQRAMVHYGLLCAVPDASRTQNIGQYDGTYAQPGDFAGTQSASFREDFGPVTYRFVDGFLQ